MLFVQFSAILGRVEVNMLMTNLANIANRLLVDAGAEAADLATWQALMATQVAFLHKVEDDLERKLAQLGQRKTLLHEVIVMLECSLQPNTATFTDTTPIKRGGNIQTLITAFLSTQLNSTARISDIYKYVTMYSAEKNCSVGSFKTTISRLGKDPTSGIVNVRRGYWRYYTEPLTTTCEGSSVVL